MRNYLFLLLMLLPGFHYGQALNSQIVVNADLVDQTNRQIFETLERALTEFINTQSWTNQEYYQCCYLQYHHRYRWFHHYRQEHDIHYKLVEVL